MDSEYFKELKPYSGSNLKNIFGEKNFNELINKRFLVKSDEDSKKFKNDCYKFRYVGMIILKDIILNCYPKYISDDADYTNHFKEIIKVIKYFNDKYKQKKLKESIDYGINNLEEMDFNLISVMLFFIEDYYENGLYTKFQDIFEINGNNEIDWNKTVNENLAIIIDYNPYYTEFQTKSKFNNLFNYFRLLHEYIITDCSKYLENTGLLETLGFTPVELSDKVLDDFGHKEIILNKLSKELNVEFNTHKRILLSLMYSYIKNKDSLTDENSLIVYGTKHYHVIWEDMLKDVFNDKLKCDLKELFPDCLNEKYEYYSTLESIIEKPRWILDEEKYDADKTLIPDIITFHTNEKGEKEFIIFDAKYYQYKLEGNNIYHQPGIGSVTKQYLYQFAYRKFIDLHDFDNVKNAFLLPSSNNGYKNKGCVILDLLSCVEWDESSKSYLKLEDIQVILLPASKINKAYLNGKKIPISKLEL